MALSHWWGPTFSSWPGNYSCCQGETGDSPHICCYGNEEVAHIWLVYSAISSSLALWTINVSRRQVHELIYMFTQGAITNLVISIQEQKYININIYELHLSSEPVNKRLLIRHAFLARVPIQKANPFSQPQVITHRDMTWMLDWFVIFKWRLTAFTPHLSWRIRPSAVVQQ